MIYFLLYLFAEVLVSVNISSAIGGIYTFLELILSAFIGVGILVNFRATLAENMRAVSVNAIDLKQFQELNLFILLGAFLLIVPGFLTDIVGVLLQFTALTSMLVNRYASKYKPENKYTQQKKDDNVIDVEIISDTSIKH